MSAQPNWRSLRQQIIDDAKHHPAGEAHLEAEDIPQYAAELGHDDVINSLCEALAECDGKPRERLCALWEAYCKHGDDMPMAKAMDLLSAMRAAHLDDLMDEAQRIVDEALS